MSSGTLQVRRKGPVCFVQMHRPDAGNTLNAPLVRELGSVLRQASQDDATTVVVLEGLPEVFCLGADFGEISQAAQQDGGMSFEPEELLAVLELLAFGACMTVAHVRGRANAGGLGLVAACDIAIADESAGFGLSELLFGLTPALVLPFLVRRLGFQRAHYLAASAQAIGARQACDWGLLDACQADSQACLARHLSRLGRMGKAGIRRYKGYLRELAPLGAATREAALRTNREMFADADNIAAIRRYAEHGLFPWEQATPA